MSTIENVTHQQHGSERRARVPLISPPGVLGRLYTWYSRRKFGAVLEPGLAMSANRQVLRIAAVQESQLTSLRALDPTIRTLAELAAARVIGCSWCVDFGYWHGREQGVPAAKVDAIAHSQDASAYTPTERRVIAYAEAMTATPPAVDDAAVKLLRDDLGDESLVALTYLISVENQRSRFNAALGLASQGFSESCRVPTR